MLVTKHGAPVAVVIILPNQATFDPSSVYNVAVRVGNTLPSTSATAPKDPSTINSLCAYTAGPLGTQRGQIVRVQCDAPVDGRLVTVQIRCETLH